MTFEIVFTRAGRQISELWSPSGETSTDKLVRPQQGHVDDVLKALPTPRQIEGAV